MTFSGIVVVLGKCYTFATSARNGLQPPCEPDKAKWLQTMGKGTKQMGGCGSGVEPVSCYQKVAGLIPLICMLKCPWARHQTPNCSWCHHHQYMNIWITVSGFEEKHPYTWNTNVNKSVWSTHLFLTPFLGAHFHSSSTWLRFTPGTYRWTPTSVAGGPPVL